MEYRSIIGYEENGKFHISFGEDEGEIRLYGKILLNYYKCINTVKKLVSKYDHDTVPRNLDHIYCYSKQKELVLNSIEEIFDYYKRHHIWYLYLFKDNNWFIWKDFGFDEYGNEINIPECEHQFIPLEDLYLKYAIKYMDSIIKVRFEDLKLVNKNAEKLSKEDNDRLIELYDKVNEINKILGIKNEKNIL